MIDTIAALSGLAAGVILPPVLRRSAPADRPNQVGRGGAAVKDRFEPNARIEEVNLGLTYDRTGRLTGQVQPRPLQADASSDARVTDATPDADSPGAPSNAASADAKLATGANLSPEDRQQVEQMKKRDTDVRAHEQAHKSAGGELAGGISFTMKRGPDGQQYAVGGEVPIDVSPVKDNPEATIAKMQRVHQAALAPANPSGQDQAVAAEATQIEQQARAEMVKTTSNTVSNSGALASNSQSDSSDASYAQQESGTLLDVAA